MKNGWLIAGAVFGCTAGIGLVACGSSTATTTGTTGTATHSTSAGTTSTSGSTGSGGATTSTTGTATGGGTSTTGTATGGSTTTTAECGKVTTLHPPKADAGAGSIYCPFSATTDGGPAEYCTPGTQHCCETPEGNATPSACVTTTACPGTGTGFTDWACEDPVADCTTTDPVCCAQGATLVLGVPQGAMQCGNYASEMKSTSCVAAGACTGIIMCTSNAECPSAHPTCTPFAKAGNDVGGCM